MRTCIIHRSIVHLAITALSILTVLDGALTAPNSKRANAATIRASYSKPPTPFFHFLWKEEISEPALRAAVADTTGDGKPRLILLIEKPQQAGSAKLVVKKWSGKEFATEFTGSVEAPADQLAVGRFAGRDKPAEIVTAVALWTWNGTTYVRKPEKYAMSIFGVAKTHAGDERLILSESPTQFKSYAVNPDGADDWLSDKSDAPTATQVDWESMRAKPDFFRKMGMPTYLGSGGLITIWDTTRSNAPYIFSCRPAPDLAAAANGGPLKTDSYIGFRDATDPGGNELWTTTKLNGLATDMALEDAKTPSKRGLLILTSGASEGKARTLYFYGLG